VIDVMCPIRAGGSVAIAGQYRTGIPVVLEEIVRRISKAIIRFNIFVPYPTPSEMWPPSLDKDYSIADALKQDGLSEGTVGCVQTFSSAAQRARGRRKNSPPWRRSIR